MRRITLDVVALNTEAKEAAERRDRPRLARRCRAMRRLMREETTQVRRAGIGQLADSLRAQEVQARAHVALVCLAGQLGEAALDTAVDDEVR